MLVHHQTLFRNQWLQRVTAFRFESEKVYCDKHWPSGARLSIKGGLADFDFCVYNVSWYLESDVSVSSQLEVIQSCFLQECFNLQNQGVFGQDILLLFCWRCLEFLSVKRSITLSQHVYWRIISSSQDLDIWFLYFKWKRIKIILPRK